MWDAAQQRVTINLFKKKHVNSNFWKEHHADA